MVATRRTPDRPSSVKGDISHVAIVEIGGRGETVATAAIVIATVDATGDIEDGDAEVAEVPAAAAAVVRGAVARRWPGISSRHRRRPSY